MMLRGFVVAMALGATLMLPAFAPAHPAAIGGGSFDSSGTWSLLCGGPDPDDCALRGDESPGNARGKGLGLSLVSNTPKAGLTGTNSDLAFWGDYAFQGNYNGINVWDISDPAAPELVVEKACPGSQNDVSVFQGILIASVDSPRTTETCSPSTPADTLVPAFEGLRIFEFSGGEGASLQHVKSVLTDCGSHTHTLVPDLENGRLLVYVSSYSPSTTSVNCQPPHDKISIVEIPLDEPAAAKVIAEPVLFPGTTGASSTSGCHDITVYQAIGLAAGACMGNGIIMDISDPADPQVLSRFTDPKFSFWHSATFSNDGQTVIFTDEWGGGTQARCKREDDPERGTDAFYDISDPANPVLLERFKIPRLQTAQENCVSHNGVLVPHQGRDLFVQAWYQGGTSIIEFTDPTNIREIAYYDRGPVNTGSLVSGGHWSSYWYDGMIYGSEIARGFDVLKDSVGAQAVVQPYLNAQTQEPFVFRK